MVSHAGAANSPGLFCKNGIWRAIICRLGLIGASKQHKSADWVSARESIRETHTATIINSLPAWWVLLTGHTRTCARWNNNHTRSLSHAVRESERAHIQNSKKARIASNLAPASPNARRKNENRVTRDKCWTRVTFDGANLVLGRAILTAKASFGHSINYLAPRGGRRVTTVLSILLSGVILTMRSLHTLRHKRFYCINNQQHASFNQSVMLTVDVDL